MQKKSLISTRKIESFHWIKNDSPCWVQTTSPKEPFIKGQIISFDLKQFQAQAKILNENDKKIEVPLDFLLERSELDQIYDDMVNIDCLNEAELLSNLQSRFINNEEIFTYVGPTLLIINPYKLLPEVFSIANLALYQKEVNNSAFTLKDFKPHIYAIAADVFKKLFENHQNQAMVISGESGAGKTETVKYAMEFLTSLGNVTESRNFAKDLFKKNSSAYKRLSIKKEAIEEKILSCNPILEAFGNAKTVRNDNSSRFGKYVTLFVNKESKKIVGASLVNYLLEKSRLVSQAENERNYHIFYYLLNSEDEDIKIDLEFNKAGKENNVSTNDFFYLSNSQKQTTKQPQEKLMFAEIEEAMIVTGFSKHDRKAVWNLISAILHLGNLVFDDKDKGDTTPCTIQSRYDILSVLETLLSIDSKALTKSLLYKTREINKQTINSPLSLSDCYMIRDSIAKDLYDRLFNWLIRKLNHTIKVLPPAPKENFLCIGLLDIFGFECFQTNSFEQLCINYTNEKLQQLFISYVFKAEKEEFIIEDLEKHICELNFQDNQPIIDLLEQPPVGLFSLLDESCAVAGDDEKLLNKIRNSHKQNANFLIPKLNKDGFIIVHTAKDVEYNIIGFREKNKDELPKNIPEVFETSKNQYIACIYKNEEIGEFHEAKNPTKRDSKFPVFLNQNNQKSLSFKFRLQMKELMNELKSCECHFIRCIKPNEEKKPNVWNGGLVLQQIRYLGVLESIKVRKESFPIRRPYALFYQKYEDLRASGSSFLSLKHGNNADFKTLTRELLNNCLENELILYGKTKVFLKNSTFLLLENLYKAKMLMKNEHASKIQKAFYRYKQMKKLRMMFKALKKIKTLWKVRQEYLHFQKLRRATRKIQLFFKKKIEKNRVSYRKKQAAVVQLFVRRYLAMKKLANVKKLGEKVQKITRVMRKWRVFRQKERVRQVSQVVLETVFEKAWGLILNKRIIIIQKFVRGFLCRKKHKNVVKKAKEARRQFLIKKSTINIQKNYKAQKFRKEFLLKRSASNAIKGFFLTRNLQQRFKQMRNSALVIQRILKPLLQRNLLTNKINKEYLEKHENLLQAQQNSIEALLFPQENPASFDKSLKYATPPRKNEELLSDTIKKHVIFNKSKEKTLFSTPQAPKISSPIKELTPYSSKSIEILLLLLDIDMMLDFSDIYSPSWVETFLNIQQEIIKTDQNMLYFTLGDTHSLCISSSNCLYSWGCNDFLQLGSETSPQNTCILNNNKKYKPKLLTSGDLFSAMVDRNNRLFCWGTLNSGNFSYNLRFPHEIPLLLDESEQVKQLKAKGNVLYLVTNQGKLWVYPQKPHAFSDKISLFRFPTNITVSQISCSYHFLVILSVSGLLYSLGSNNEAGELGLGDTKPRLLPNLIETLQQEKIDGVDCGYRHVICKTTTGKVFTWGWGAKGQLGNEKQTNALSPMIIPLTIGYKALQVCAGYACSVILMENRKVFWCGSNKTIKNLLGFKEISVGNKFSGFDERILPVRIVAQWTKTASLVFFNAADMRNVAVNHEMRHKICNILGNKWQNESIFYINPPFVESIARYFSHKVMKIKTENKEKRNKSVESPRESEEKKEKNEKVQKNNEKKCDYNEKIENTLNEMKKNHIEMIKQRIDKLKKLGENKWNEKDFEFMDIVKNPQIAQFLNI